MKGTNHRQISYAEAAAKDNSLFTIWTDRWGMHVRPWYSMDRLMFSFVEVGTAGKGNSFDICMDVIKFGFPCFKKWAEDILSPTGRFERIMAGESKAEEQYPKYYKYTTGVDGSKTIGICNSRKGGRYVINASVTKDGKRVFANIPVDFGDLVILAENFKRSYEAREMELVKIREEAEKAKSVHYTDLDASDKRPVVPNVEDELAQQNTTLNKSSDSTNVNNNVGMTNASEITQMRVKVSKPVKLEGEFMFEGLTCDTKERVELFVSNKTLKGSQKEQWGRLNDMLKKDNVTITFNVIDADRIDIVSIAA